jgi:hypothetical protein
VQGREIDLSALICPDAHDGCRLSTERTTFKSGDLPPGCWARGGTNGVVHPPIESDRTWVGSTLVS